MAHALFKLLEKYDVPGPRYTSYPTVPAWTTDVGEHDFRSSLAALKPGEHLSLYFHIPFCETLCHFCGCMKVITKDHSRSRDYVDLLLSEIDRIAGLIPKEAKEAVQIQFGGGTPNFLQPSELEEIMTRVRSRFQFLKDAEIAIEMHPKTSTVAFCERLAKLGFNRISLGVQDFDPQVQKLINRHQTYEMTEAMVSLLRKLGFNAFNFDLIYGLPGQTMEEWRKTWEKILHLRPNRLAVYSYAHVPWVKPYQRSFEDKDLPSPEMKLRLFEEAYRILTQNGYRLIGMDHFALADDELSRALDEGTIHRNFMGYATRAEAHQIGFGVSAISYVGGNYFQNEKELETYSQAVRGGRLATFRGYLLNRDDTIRKDLIRRIMCSGLVRIPEFERQWEIDFRNYFQNDLPELAGFLQNGLLKFDSDEIRIVGEGFLFLRNIAMVFDRYLEEIRREASTPVFSRTV
jgi:oxygen-independent coproporphyrinogen-3 oxidase